MIRICAIMQNPSKASAFSTDPTMNKWRALLRRWYPAVVQGGPFMDAWPREDETTYRYLLVRRWATLVDHLELRVVNLFAYRATQPRDLWEAQRRGVDVVGPGNEGAFAHATASADLVIAAWGAHTRAQERAREVCAWLADRRIPLHYLALSKDGRPKHPLYLPGDVTPVPWTEAA